MSNFIDNLKKAKDPRRLLCFLMRTCGASLWPDETYLRVYYYIAIGKKLNLDNPQTFNEKLQWLKLHDRRPEYTRMVDKYEAKKYVAEKIGEEYIIPTLGVWDHFDDIDFNSLPNQFVLKCTHDSGGLVICKDKSKLDVKKAKRKIENCLKQDFFIKYREWPYKDVKRRIIAEKYMEEKGEGELKDYKIFNFDGKAKVIQVDYGRFTKHMRNLYSTQWDYIEASICYPTDPNHKIPKPEKLEEMLALAEKLSVGIPHVRTDFYYIDDKIYFGELTFYHGSGIETFVPEEYGLTMGEYLKLPWGGVILKCEGYIMWIHKEQDNGLKDYKLHCFNGEPKLTLVCSDRFAEGGLCEDFFDNDWGHLPIRRPSHPNAPHDIACPKNFEMMKQLARQLSENIPFVRVDFYEIDGRVYFGELTFYPTSGFEKFELEGWDDKIGKMLEITKKS